MALSASKQRVWKDVCPTVKSHQVNAASVIYKGGLVVKDTDGYARPGVDTASFRVVGLAMEDVTGGSSDGDVEVKVLSGILVKLPATSLAKTDEDQIMYLVDDDTVDETTPANSVKVGRLIEYVSATEGWVYIPPFGTTE